MFSFASRGELQAGRRGTDRGCKTGQVAGLRRGYASKMEGVSSSQRCVRAASVCVLCLGVCFVCV